MFTIRIYTFDRAGFRFSFLIQLPRLDRKRAAHLARREVRRMNRGAKEKVRSFAYGRAANQVRV